MSGLFASTDGIEHLADGVVVWHRAVDEEQYLAMILGIAQEAPFRHMRTPGGRQMSVAMTNCGALGWVSDADGYRYDACDPDSGMPWPEMPAAWRRDAKLAADRCGYANFEPDACLINRYEAGARMAAHQDRNEADFSQPVVSVSLGLTAQFVFHGESRAGPPRVVELVSGDALVWGGAARLHFHAVRPLPAGRHPLCGALRYNLTFRRAGP